MSDKIGHPAQSLRNVTGMDTVLDHAWTAETFLAWEDRQEGKHEFDGQTVIPMTGGNIAHQDIVFNLRSLLGRLLAAGSFRAADKMRLRIAERGYAIPT